MLEVVAPNMDYRPRETHSLAWLLACAAAADVNVGRWEWDDGIDLSLAPRNVAENGYRTVHVQLKTAGLHEASETGVSTQLRRDRYETLHGVPGRGGIVVIVVTPESSDHWIDVNTQPHSFLGVSALAEPLELRAKPWLFSPLVLMNRAYWTAVADGPDPAGIREEQHDVSVRCPTANVLTPAALRAVVMGEEVAA